MIFSSPEYCFVFLPTVVLIYYYILRTSHSDFIAPFIVISSLIFYIFWNINNIFVILFSIIFNYIYGKIINNKSIYRKIIFVFGVIINILILCYYKYTDFCIENINYIFNSNIPLQNIILPLGISFFTFQQIAWLSDIYTKKYNSESEGFINYCCFVCFFPQLIAGPIVHHQEMIPQFYAVGNQKINWQNIFYGLVIFSIGLSKKLIIADSLSPIVQYTFDKAGSLSILEALFGSISYTLQLYFDFSGYSDMAVGAALFFNIHLPWNFNSPYKARNIQDFWRRWHITLSRWLRDYLYIPLGGNRKGKFTTLLNLFITFILGGLWHGAAWTFIIWGALHGIALIIHRIFSQFLNKKMPSIMAWLVTFGFINFGWIVFRVPNIERISVFLKAFLCWNGVGFRISYKEAIIHSSNFPSFAFAILFVISCFSISVIFPNTSEIYKKSPSKCLLYSVILTLTSLYYMFSPNDHPEFIYSNF